MRHVGRELDGVALGELVALLADLEHEAPGRHDEVLARPRGVGLGVLAAVTGQPELVELEGALVVGREERAGGEATVGVDDALGAGVAEDASLGPPGSRQQRGERHAEGEGDLPQRAEAWNRATELDLTEGLPADAAEARQDVEGVAALRAQVLDVGADDGVELGVGPLLGGRRRGLLDGKPLLAPARGPTVEAQDLREAARLRELRRLHATSPSLAHEEHARAQVRGLRIRAQLSERDEPRAGQVPRRPLVRLADVDHVDATRGDELLRFTRSDPANHPVAER